MSVGHHPSVGSYKPDMKKDEADITVEDRQEAKRRIEGSLANDGESSADREGGMLHAVHFS
jgi:phosphatidylserine decarboxylase